MDLRDELARQSLLLDFIFECVGLQSVPELAKLVTARLHWICDYETCSALLPGAQGPSMWTQDRKAGAAARIDSDAVLATHRTALDNALAKGAPMVAQSPDSGMSMAALPLGSKNGVLGALCIARATKGFSQGDIRHLQHASNALGGALTRIAALATEHEAERAIKLAESKLRATAEDRALLAEQMVGIVSHDLRNPLSAILTGIHLLEKGEALPPQKERVVQKVRSAARRAQRLIEELLDFTQARIGSGLTLKRIEVDLDDLVDSVLDELRLSFSGVELLHPESVLGMGYLDADRIHQLLGNLVANAATHGTRGRPIHLGCEVVDGELTLTVRNEGDVIPEAMFATMFEPMSRGQENQSERDGVGLGLYIVRAIAEGHHGSVDVSSSVEDGTCFTVRMPIDCRVT